MSGTLATLTAVASPELGNERDVVVALPPSYATGDQRYPVLYLQDGQNLFDPATSFAGDWDLGTTLAAAAARGLEVIVVAVPSIGERRATEYAPVADPTQGEGRGPDYVRFLAETLKPLVDEAYRTRPDRVHTAIAGSSMGGLVSLYALFARPDTFGAAGALSPSLDARRMRDLLVAKGWRLGEDLAYQEDEAGTHQESAWGRRFRDALPFLLAGPGGGDVAA